MAVGGPLLQDTWRRDRGRTRGRVHVNDERVKPAKDVRPGDRLEVTTGATRRTVIVRALADKRGPATVAATLYEETPESLALRERRAAESRLARPLGADLGARPTKQDRRRLEALAVRSGAAPEVDDGVSAHRSGYRGSDNPERGASRWRPRCAMR